MATVEGSVERACKLLARLQLPKNAGPEAMQRIVDELMVASRDQSPANALGSLRQQIQHEAAKQDACHVQGQVTRSREKKLATTKRSKP